MEKAGGCGRYQLWVTVIMMAGMLSGGMLIHGVAYLELAPTGPGTDPNTPPYYMQYMCTNTTD